MEEYLYSLSNLHTNPHWIAMNVNAVAYFKGISAARLATITL